MMSRFFTKAVLGAAIGIGLMAGTASAAPFHGGHAPQVMAATPVHWDHRPHYAPPPPPPRHYGWHRPAPRYYGPPPRHWHHPPYRAYGWR